MKLISWNVNGLRACMGKGFLDFVAAEQPDMLCLQETKMQPGQADVPLEGGYREYWNSAEKKGYSGVALFTKTEPQSVTYGLGIEEHDHEGRGRNRQFLEKSNTFSRPTIAARLFPYSNSSRIVERRLPKSIMCSFIMVIYSCQGFSLRKLLPSLYHTILSE